MGTQRVTEAFAFSGGAVDRSGKYPVVRGVLLCGRESAWKRRYLPEAFAGDRVLRYEGRPVNLDHTGEKGARKFRDKIGWVENPRVNADGLPVGDIGINPKHPMAETVLWAAENKPDYCSMSHVADIDTRDAADGWKEVRECRYVESVDIVTSGATTGSLYSEGKPVPQTAKEYADRLAPRCSVEQLLKLRSLVKEDDMGGAAMPADAPPPDTADPDDGISAAFKAAIMGEIEKCMGGDGDPKACLKKIKKLLNSHGDIKDDGGDDGEDEEDAEVEAEADPKAKEGKGGKGKVRETAPDPWSLMDECAKEAFSPSAVQLKALKGMGDPADRTAFIREQKGLSAAKPPKSASREQLAGKVQEGKGDQPAPTGVEEARQVMANLAKEARGAK